MVSLNLICVGKLKEKFYLSACDEYAKRLSAYCNFKLTELSEERLPQNPSDAKIFNALQKEAAQITPLLKKDAYTIAMCIEGKELSSPLLAELLSARMNAGVSAFNVIIGGSCGLSEEIKKQADYRLSMSPMTFPHHLARVMVLEQLYRAFNINSGGKYHK